MNIRDVAGDATRIPASLPAKALRALGDRGAVGVNGGAGAGCAWYRLFYNDIYLFYYQLAGAGTSYKKK